MNAEKGCICTAGDPCDYHAATCITCIGGCQGHPVKVDKALDKPRRFVWGGRARIDPSKALHKKKEVRR